MKRRIALFMVLAMLVSLVPMNVFADSSNTADRVLTVADDATLRVNTAADGGITANYLQLVEKTKDQWDNQTQTFRLSLTNGEWIFNASNAATTMAAGVTSSDGTVTATANKISANIVEITMQTGAGAGAGTERTIKIPMELDVTGAGEVKVAVEDRGSFLTGSSVVVANAGSGATKVTVESKTFAASTTLNNIIIDEIKLGSLKTGDNVIKLHLPSGFEWTSTATTAFNVNRAGGFGSATGIETAATWSSSTPQDLTINFNLATASTAQVGTIILEGLTCKSTSDAKVGDVNVVMTAESSNTKVTGETFKVGTYSDYTVAITANEAARTLYSGEWASINTGNDDVHKLAEMKIKEDVDASWSAQKRTIVEFPAGVKVLGFKITKQENIVSGYTTDNYNNVVATNSNKVEWVMNAPTAGKKADFRVVFYVSVQADFAGDITAKVSGSSIGKEVSVVLGKAVVPATFVGTVKDVKIGVQNQPIGDLTITEAAGAVWEQGKDIVVYLPTGFKWKTTPTVKVTKGDIILKTDNITASGTDLTIPVKYKSSVASEISITGGTVTLDRTVPEGEFKVNVGGSSMVRNDDNGTEWQTGSVAENGKFDQDSVGAAVYARVITPAPGDTTSIAKVVYTIDSKEYTIGGVAAPAMDVAPFINEQNRTMLPLRAFANALNVTDENILWNEADRSVTIFKGDATIKVIIGQMSFNKNGVVVPMDTMAIIKEGRTFLPLRAVAQALGATIVWDEATRTVTVQ